MKIAHILGAVCAITVQLLSLHGAGVAQTVTSGQPIVIGTASPGGPYLAYGQGIARILSRELRQEFTAQATQGPAQNIVS